VKVIDKNWKLFGRIHLLDLIPLVLILLIVIGIGSKMGVGETLLSSGTEEKKLLRIMCQTEPMDPIMLKNIQVGDRLAENKGYIPAKIISVDIIENQVGLRDNKGQEVVGINPLAKVAMIGIEIETTFKEPMYLVKSKDINEVFIGKKFYMTTQDSKLVVIVTGLEEVE